MVAPRTQTFELAGLTWQVSPLDTDQQFEAECIFIKALAPPLASGLAAAVQGAAAPLVEVLGETVMGGGRYLAEFDSQERAEEAREHSTVIDRGESVAMRWAVVDPAGRAIHETEYEDDARNGLRELAAGRVAKRGGKWIVLEQARDEKFDIANLLGIDTSDPRLRGTWEKLLEAMADTSGSILREVVYTLVRHLDHQDIKRLIDLAVFSSHTLVCDPTGERFHASFHDLGHRPDYAVLSNLLRRDPNAKYQLLSKAILVTYGRHAVDEDEDA